MFKEELLEYFPFQKVFRICVRKQVSLFDILRFNTFKEFNSQVYEDYHLTEKEFNLIKGLANYVRSL